MNSKQKKIVIVVLALAVFSLLALSLYLAGGRGKETPGGNRTSPPSMTSGTAAPAPTATPDPHAGMVRSRITGQWIKKKTARKRCFAVVINNIEYAFRRQKGTSKADVVYEALAEGGITRMMAVYEDISGVKKIGSVRSARHYFVQLAKEWDAVFCHFGHTKYAVSKMKRLSTDNLSGLSAIGGIVYSRDRSISAPHNVFTDGKRVKKGAGKLGYSLKRDESMMAEHFTFHETDIELPDGKKAEKITIPFSDYSTCKMKYDAKKRVYKKYEYGQKHIDSHYKKQLAFKNVIIQLVKEKNIDHNGYQTMSLSNNKGEGYYYTDGRRVKITWSRNESANKMSYYDKDGRLLTVNPGKTYIAVYPKNRKNLIQ